MKAEIKVPFFIYDDEQEESYLQIFPVIWDSEKGSFTGYQRAVKYLYWLTEKAVRERWSIKVHQHTFEVKNPLTEPSELVILLQKAQLNIPEPLMEHLPYNYLDDEFEEYEFYQSNPSKEEIEAYEAMKANLCY
ncbi:hypothetical protein A4G18_00470 [Pasteurellaceae bacterium Pebbles2]|nr:hypothetical protein [Pasteurellaceae bacterium Pebbles2]